MANSDVLLKVGLQFLFADHATDFGAAPATAGNSLIIGAPTDVQMDLTGNSTARESVQFNLTTPWANQWILKACLEFESAPTDGGRVEFFIGESPSATAATGNPGGLTGADANFTDTTGNKGQLTRIGVLTVKNTVINIGRVGIFRPKTQYGILVIVNEASTALRSTATAMDETHITLTEIIDEIQIA